MKKITLISISLFMSFQLFAMSPEEKGLDIAKKAEKANEGFSGEVTEMEMVLISAHGDKATRKMTSKILERKNEGDMSINEFLWPADVKGTKLLTHAYKDKSDDQWLYLPSLKRVKRISSRNKSGSYMGSEFSYEDLGSQEPEKFSHKFLRDDKVNGRDVWVTERQPKDKSSGYSKQVSFIDKEYMNPVKIEYYDRKGELLKTAIFSEYKKYLDKLWRAHKIEMNNVQTKKSSVITWSKRDLGKKFSAKDFNANSFAETF